MLADTLSIDVAASEGVAFARLGAWIAGLGWEQIDEQALATIDAAMASGAPVLVLDLAEVPVLCAEHLAYLLRCWRHFDARSGRLALCGVGPQQRELLEMTALEGQFRVFADRAAAVASLGQTTTPGGGR